MARRRGRGPELALIAVAAAVCHAATDDEYRKVLADRQLRDARRRREFAAPPDRLDVGGIDDTPDAALAVASAPADGAASDVERDARPRSVKKRPTWADAEDDGDLPVLGSFKKAL